MANVFERREVTEGGHQDPEEGASERWDGHLAPPPPHVLRVMWMRRRGGGWLVFGQFRGAVEGATAGASSSRGCW